MTDINIYIKTALKYFPVVFRTKMNKRKVFINKICFETSIISIEIWFFVGVRLKLKSLKHMTLKVQGTCFTNHMTLEIVYI